MSKSQKIIFYVACAIATSLLIMNVVKIQELFNNYDKIACEQMILDSLVNS